MKRALFDLYQSKVFNQGKLVGIGQSLRRCDNYASLTLFYLVLIKPESGSVENATRSIDYVADVVALNQNAFVLANKVVKFAVDLSQLGLVPRPHAFPFAFNKL